MSKALSWLNKLSHRWKWPKVLYALFIIEFLATIAALALFGIASPDLYRTQLWQVGYDNGFNSSPKQVLYAYANYRPIPKVPFVWSDGMTEFNLVLSVLSTFLLLVKVTMFVLHIWYPLLGTFMNGVMTGLWAAAIWGQAGPDYSDPLYPSKSAWYVTKSCDYAKDAGIVGYCQQAKAGFAVSVFLTAIFLANFILAVWSCIPSAAQRQASKMEVDDLQGGGERKGSPVSESSYDRSWEMKNVPATANPLVQPFTPRTQAFHRLDRFA